MITSSKIELKRIWIDDDTNIFYRARKTFYAHQIESVEEYVYSDFKEHTDKSICCIYANDECFFAEIDYDLMLSIWDNSQINIFN